MDQYFNKIHWQSQLPFSLDLSKQSVRQSPTVEKSSHPPPALVLGPLLRQDKTAQPTDLEFPSSAKLWAFLSKVSCYYFNSHPLKVAVSNFWQPSRTCYSIPSSSNYLDNLHVLFHYISIAVSSIFSKNVCPSVLPPTCLRWGFSYRLSSEPCSSRLFLLLCKTSVNLCSSLTDIQVSTT